MLALLLLLVAFSKGTASACDGLVQIEEANYMTDKADLFCPMALVWPFIKLDLRALKLASMLYLGSPGVRLSLLNTVSLKMLNGQGTWIGLFNCTSQKFAWLPPTYGRSYVTAYPYVCNTRIASWHSYGAVRRIAILRAAYCKLIKVLGMAADSFDESHRKSC